MDDSGNILIKRIAKANVYVKNGEGENAVANEILKVPGGALELDKPVKLFDMKKFQQNVARELKRAYPDRRKLECQVSGSAAWPAGAPELTPHVPVHLLRGLCEERVGVAGAALLGDAHQRGGDGHAALQDTTR